MRLWRPGGSLGSPARRHRRRAAPLAGGHGRGASPSAPEAACRRGGGAVGPCAPLPRRLVLDLSDQFVLPTGPDGRPVAELRAFTHGLMPKTVPAMMQAFCEDWAERGVDAWNGVPDRWDIGHATSWWTLPEDLGDRWIAPILGAARGTCVMQPNVHWSVAALLSCDAPFAGRTGVVLSEAEFPSVRHNVRQWAGLREIDMHEVTASGGGASGARLDRRGPAGCHHGRHGLGLRLPRRLRQRREDARRRHPRPRRPRARQRRPPLRGRLPRDGLRRRRRRGSRRRRLRRRPLERGERLVGQLLPLRPPRPRPPPAPRGLVRRRRPVRLQRVARAAPRRSSPLPGGHDRRGLPVPRRRRPARAPRPRARRRPRRLARQDAPSPSRSWTPSPLATGTRRPLAATASASARLARPSGAARW